MKYIAFISYRHTPGSRMHAERLESALKVYAKPLWKAPRAIFRDERVLRPGDDLPSTLREALTQSSFLIYLASKEAADSEWIAEELRIWCEELGRSKDLILVHLGDRITVDRKSDSIVWSRTDALPLVLKPYVKHIPIWADLTWAKKEEQLDLNNLEYKKQVNAIIARVLGKTPGEMNDEQVLVHRRNLAWRNAGIVTVTVLSIIATVFWFQASRQRDLALRRQLAAQGYAYADDQLDLSLLLSLESDPAKNLEGKTALLRALQRHAGIKSFFRSDKGAVTGLAFVGGSRMLAVAHANREILLLDVEAGRPVSAPIRPHDSRFITLAANPQERTFVSASEDGRICVHRLGKLNAVRCRETSGALVGLSLSPDGTAMASVTQDGVITLLDPATAAPIGGRFKVPSAQRVHDLAFSPSGHILAISEPGAVHLWDWVAGKSVPPPVEIPLIECFGCTDSMEFSPDGRTLAVAESNLHLLDLSTHRRVESRDIYDLAGNVRFSPDGKHILVGTEREVLVMDLMPGQRERKVRNPLTGNATRITKLDISPDGKLIAAGGENGTVIVWDAEEGLPLGWRLPGSAWSHCLALSPDGNTLVTQDTSSDLILWNLRSQKGTKVALGMNGSATSCVFFPDSSRVALAFEYSRVLLLDISTRKVVELSSASDSRGRLSTLAISPEGRTIAIGYNGLVELRDVGSGGWAGPPLPAGNRPIESLAFSPDGRFLVSGDESSASLWDVETRQLRCPRIEEFEGAYNGARFSPDNRFLAAGLTGGRVVLYDVQACAVHATYSVEGDVWRLLFGEGGKTLLISTRWGVFLRDMQTGQGLGLLNTGLGGGGGPIDIDKAGDTIAVSSEEAVHVIPFGVEAWKSKACGIVKRNLNCDERQRYLGDQRPLKTCPSYPVEECGAAPSRRDSSTDEAEGLHPGPGGAAPEEPPES